MMGRDPRESVESKNKSKWALELEFLFVDNFDAQSIESHAAPYVLLISQKVMQRIVEPLQDGLFSVRHFALTSIRLTCGIVLLKMPR